jgi:hypothetical protein
MAESHRDVSQQWVEQRPSRLSVATIHTQRILNTWGNSKPYISGDLFSDEADISYQTPRFRRMKPTLREIREAKVVFCPSHLVEEFFTRFEGQARPKVLICGNSDRDFHEVPAILPPSIRHVFLQNSFIPNSSSVTAIPIGLENLRWGKNGFPKLMQNGIPWGEKIPKTMIGPFGLTHPDRYQVRDAFPTNTPEIDLFQSRLTPRLLSATSQTYQFVAAVRGNGVDTHRHWETAYRGSYALVIKDKWFENFASLGLPFIGISSWTEDEISSAMKSVTTPPRNPREMEPLWWPYWKAQIESKLY